MRLNDIKNVNINVLRDGDFYTLGNINQNKKGQLGFIEDEKYLGELLKNTNISCVITTGAIVDKLPGSIGVAISQNPRISFFMLNNYLVKNTDFYGKPFKSVISPDACIHPRAYVSEHNVQIGRGSEIGPNAAILENSYIENDVIIRAGSVIGTEGFRFERSSSGIIPFIHAGGVIIHDRVEIQANTCVCKAKFGGDFTEIGEDTKIDNLVHVGHHVKIGRRCMIAACAIIAGSTTLCDDVWMGPNACTSNELVIGDGSSVSLGAVVTQNVPPGQRVTGNFAIDHNQFIKFIKSIR